MKKNNQIIGIIIVIMLIGILNKNIEARIWTVPEFEIQITDATTGKPVENAVVRAKWNGKAAYGIMSESRGADTKSKTLITDKNGKCNIPKKISIPLIGRFVPGLINSFAGLTIEVWHPVYVNEIATLYDEDEFTGDIIICNGTKLPNGTIHYDIKLVGIEEAIRRGAEEYERTKDWHKGFNYKSYIGTYSGSFFKEHWDREFVEKVLKKWEEIANRHGGFNSSELREFNRVKKDVEKVYK